MNWLKSKGKMWNGRWIPKREMEQRRRAEKSLSERAPPEAMIDALRNIENGNGVCEMCCCSQPRNKLRTVWIGQGNDEEGLEVCQYCEVKGGE